MQLGKDKSQCAEILLIRMTDAYVGQHLNYFSKSKQVAMAKLFAVGGALIFLTIAVLCLLDPSEWITCSIIALFGLSGIVNLFLKRLELKRIMDDLNWIKRLLETSGVSIACDETSLTHPAFGSRNSVSTRGVVFLFEGQTPNTELKVVPFMKPLAFSEYEKLFRERNS